MVLRLILGIVISLVLLLGAIWISVGGIWGITLYLHWLAFLMITVLPLVQVIAVFSLKGLRQAIKLTLARETPPGSDLPAARLCIAAWRKNLYPSAAITMLTGLIAMLANIEDTAAVGAGLAVSLLVFLYAFVLDLVFLLPCKNLLEKKSA